MRGYGGYKGEGTVKNRGCRDREYKWISSRGDIRDTRRRLFFIISGFRFQGLYISVYQGGVENGSVVLKFRRLECSCDFVIRLLLFSQYSRKK